MFAEEISLDSVPLYYESFRRTRAMRLKNLEGGAADFPGWVSRSIGSEYWGEAHKSNQAFSLSKLFCKKIKLFVG